MCRCAGTYLFWLWWCWSSGWHMAGGSHGCPWGPLLVGGKPEILTSSDTLCHATHTHTHTHTCSSNIFRFYLSIKHILQILPIPLLISLSYSFLSAMHTLFIFLPHSLCAMYFFLLACSLWVRYYCLGGAVTKAMPNTNTNTNTSSFCCPTIDFLCLLDF